MLRWWNASLLALLVSGACTGTSDDTIDVTFDACSPIAIALPSDGVRATGVRDAFALWADRGVPLMGEAGGAEIELRFEEAAEAFHGLYDDEHGVIYINSKITDPKPLAIVIAHELGHAMGLPHIAGESVMRSGNISIGPTADDEARIHALWGACDSQ